MSERRSEMVSPKDLRPGDKVWLVNPGSNQCWWQTIKTIDPHGPWLAATFEPESRPAKVGYATVTPQLRVFRGKDIDTIRAGR
jgi:hypothetical protein